MKDRETVKHAVLGRPILLALEEVDGTPSFLEKALRFIEEHGRFSFLFCMLWFTQEKHRKGNTCLFCGVYNSEYILLIDQNCKRKFV